MAVDVEMRRSNRLGIVLSETLQDYWWISAVYIRLEEGLSGLIWLFTQLKH